MFINELFLDEISDDLRRSYLDRAGKHVDRRMDRMASVRDRLNKGYEIYHAEQPTKIIDRFDADTPALAKQYYDNYIANYESDVDYDLRLRRSTGIMEEATQDFLWHGSRDRISILTPQPAVDTGGNPKSNKKAIYATADKNFAIAMGLAEKGSDTAGFPNDPQLVLFSGKIRHGQMVYLHKLPMYDANGRPLFEPGGNDREFTSVPSVTKLKPIEVEEVPVDQHLNLIRQPTPKDLELKKYYLQRAKQGVTESQSVSTKDMINYIRKHHDNNLHSDYTNYITNTFIAFELKDVPVNSIKTELPKLDQAKVEQYKQMDFSKAPPIVIGDGFILDGYHRANVAKALGIPTIRAYVGVKQVAEGQRQPLDFDSLYGKVFKITDNNGNPNTPGFSIVTPLNGASWNWQERPEFKKIVKQKLNDPGFLGDHKYQQIVDAMAGKLFDPAKYLVKEITAVPTVAKSKRQHLDVMPNDGKPIPTGREEEFLTDFISKMPGGYELWAWTSYGTKTYYVYNPTTRICQLATTGKPYSENRDSFVVQGTYSGPKNQYRAADLYAFLILKLGITLVSDNKQSEGGYKVWKELERRYGKSINIHGFDTKTDKPVNVTTRDEPDTHVARSDVKRAGPQMKKELGSVGRDLRFVASAK